jgi:hypothetical protein
MGGRRARKAEVLGPWGFGRAQIRMVVGSVDYIAGAVGVDELSGGVLECG